MSEVGAPTSSTAASSSDPTQAGTGNELKVSIVMPTFKRGAFLERAIGTVFAQTHTNWELIVVDDNHPGGRHRRDTEQFMRPFLADERVVYLKHERNRGGAAARNTGILSSRGRYVAFLDDDDEWDAEKLEKQLTCFAAEPALGLVYCGYRRMYVETGQESVELPDRRRHTFAKLLAENGIGTTSTVICRRDALIDVGMFDEELPSRQDADLYVRMAREHAIGYIAEPLVTWYRHAGDAIGKNREKAVTAHRIFLHKYRRDLEKHPRAHSNRLLRYGLLLLQTGKLPEARTALWQAWRKDPASVSALWYSLFANRPGHDLYWWLLRMKRRFKLGSGGEKSAT